jgi:hypothetical protein
MTDSSKQIFEDVTIIYASAMTMMRLMALPFEFSSIDV